MHIAFVTSAAYRDLTPDDRLVAAALSERGAQVAAAVWNDPAIDWDSFDSIVVRSTWDYHRNTEQFREWIDALDAMSARVWNPPALLRWNMEKTYLRDLERAGVPIVPTEWLPRGGQPELAALMLRRGWHDVVVKPVISAAANRTWRVSLSKAPDFGAQLTESLEIGDVMVQPFVSEIQTSGEWSLMFIGGEFSHAVRKTPTKGDFRVQEHLGGDAIAADPEIKLIDVARRVLDAVPSPWLYARVDGIETATGFVLLELEMLEPSLFFSRSSAGAARFAQAIMEAR